MRKHLMNLLAFAIILGGGGYLVATPGVASAQVTPNSEVQPMAKCGRACGATCTDYKGVCTCTGPCEPGEEVEKN